MALGTKQNKVSKVLITYEINHIWTAEMKWKWRNDRRSERNLCNCVKKPEKNSGLQRGLNPWPRDTGAMLYQLSYEATDVGSRSIDLLSTSAFSKLAKLVSGRVGEASNQWHGAYSDLLPCLPGKSPGICDFFFLSWWSIPHPQARRRRQFPTPELLIDLTYVFLEYIFFRAIVISVP